MGRRAILIILDGLGIGAMPDVPDARPRNAGANTLGHIFERVPGLRLPVLQSLGLGNLVDIPALPPAGESALCSYGRCMLAHDGADTFLGHNEVMGTIPSRPAPVLFREASERVRAALEERGFRAEEAAPGGGALLVDGAILVGDNLEADPGAIFNVTAALDRVSFETTLEVARVVRGVVSVSRVVALGGPRITPADILRELRTNAAGQTGVVTPNLGIYDDAYRVCHLGYGVDAALQAPTLVARAGLPVMLIGKMADVIAAPGARAFPCVRTAEVLGRVRDELAATRAGLLAATVQETDLAGHEEDPGRYAAVLREADALIGRIVGALREGDLLIISADHGNDPADGRRFHTREMTPLLVSIRGRRAMDLGVRRTLADIGATIADYLARQRTAAGESFLGALEAASFSYTPTTIPL